MAFAGVETVDAALSLPADPGRSGSADADLAPGRCQRTSRQERERSRKRERGDLQPYEDHVLTGGVAVLEASIEGIEPTGDGGALRVTVRP
jgi:hypothetical protein